MNHPRTTLEATALDHYARVLGGKGPSELVESGGPVAVMQYLDFEVGVTHYATLGAATAGIAFANPSEFVVSVRPGQDAEGRALLHAALLAAQRMDGAISFGSHFVSPYQPLVATLPIHGLLFDASPWSDQLDLVLAPDESVIELAVLTVMPMTIEDLELLTERGIEAYDEQLGATDADVYDLFRTGRI